MMRPVSTRKARVKPISRDSLRRKIRDVLIDSLMTGSLPPGSRINESQLAEGLGVSQTPVREALLGLEGQGFVVARPGKGFFVEEFTEREVREIYPVLAKLEVVALEASGVPSLKTLDELDRINEEFDRVAGRPARAVEVDDRFHTLLLSGCSNEYLLRLVSQTRRATFRYEYAYMVDRQLTSESSRRHGQIVASLRAGDLRNAVVRLRQTWRVSGNDILRWLADLQSSG